MSKLNAFLLATLLVFIPASAFAEVSLSDMLEEDESASAFNLEVSPDLDLLDIAVPGPRPGPGPGPGPRPRPGARPAPGPAPVHHVTHVRHYRTNVRPRQVVVVEQPATVVVSDTEESTPKKKQKPGHFGMGIRGVGLTGSNLVLSDGAEISSKISGGIGFYLKLRPIRWISVEFINDYMFGHFDELSSGCNEYFRVPLVVGLRGHVFDYGNLDVYGVAAASVTFVTYDDGNDHLDQEKRFPQFGGQFGAGISLIAGAFEIGLDVRYTVEEAPDEAPFGFGEVDQDKAIHGFLFSLNVGFAI